MDQTSCNTQSNSTRAASAQMDRRVRPVTASTAAALATSGASASLTLVSACAKRKSAASW
jgi:hypothetical protein